MHPFDHDYNCVLRLYWKMFVPGMKQQLFFVFKICSYSWNCRLLTLCHMVKQQTHVYTKLWYEWLSVPIFHLMFLVICFFYPWLVLFSLSERITLYTSSILTLNFPFYVLYSFNASNVSHKPKILKRISLDRLWQQHVSCSISPRHQMRFWLTLNFI